MKKRWQHKTHHNSLPVNTHRYLGQFELADGQWIYHTAATPPLNNIDPDGRDVYSLYPNGGFFWRCTTT